MSLVYPSSSATPRLDPNGLYILLSDIGGNNRFHWALYLSQPAPSIDATESDVPYGDERAHPQTQTQTQDQTQPRNQNPAHAQAHKGTIFHLLSDPNDNTSWTYSVLPNTPISSLERPFLVAMKIGDIDPVLHEALAERLAQIVEDHQYYSVRFREGMTSRVWIKEAVWALNEEGYINLVQSGSKEVVEKIENEAMMLAMRCSYRSEQMVLTSSWCVI